MEYCRCFHNTRRDPTCRQYKQHNSNSKHHKAASTEQCAISGASLWCMLCYLSTSLHSYRAMQRPWDDSNQFVSVESNKNKHMEGKSSVHHLCLTCLFAIKYVTRQFAVRTNKIGMQRPAMRPTSFLSMSGRQRGVKLYLLAMYVMSSACLHESS